MQRDRVAALASAVAISSALASGVATADSEAEFDWSQHAEVDTIYVLTQDEDGDPRETKIWLLVVDGEPYIRTGGSTWGDNVEREPEIALRIGEQEIPVRADFVEEDAQREAVAAAFREKYGGIDWWISWIRGPRPRIMHLSLR